MKEGGVGQEVHMKGGDPGQEAEKGGDHHHDPGQGHMKDDEVAQEEDQGHTVVLRQGHQAVERKSPQPETVTAVAGVEVPLQVLPIKMFLTLNKPSINFKEEDTVTLICFILVNKSFI